VPTPYPTSFDVFNEPSLPEETPLSSAGSATRNHTEHHRDLGDAIEALEQLTSLALHDHSGDGTDITRGIKLLQSNTHEGADTDTAPDSIHHSIGLGPLQAAAGNHAHDYDGPSIFNKPYIRCTSTTRPLNPLPGQMIWETDTNCVRAWAAFPNNVYVAMPPPAYLNYTYTFNTNNNANSLDPAIFSQTYPVGATPTNGAMGAPSAGNCQWNTTLATSGNRVDCRCIARAVATGNAHTLTDDQVITINTGALNMTGYNNIPVYTGPGHCVVTPDFTPTNDVYLRMSDDGQSYVRFMISFFGIAFFYTTTGPTGETLLGATLASWTHTPRMQWQIKVSGNTYTANSIRIKSDGTPIPNSWEQVMGIVDYNNVVNVGASYRGWAIGMAAGQSNVPALLPQLRPNNLIQVTAQDLGATFAGTQGYGQYQTQFLWQLLGTGYTPTLHAEARTSTQQVGVAERHVLWWTDVIEDFFWYQVLSPKRFLKLEVSNTDIVVQEAGHYHLHASLCWDPANTWNDHAMIAVEVNGADIARRNWEFVRGFNYTPGFSQTNEMSINWYFAQGDVIRIIAQHNASKPCFLWWWPLSHADHQSQVCYVDLSFIKP
jgi:hypothetical protein